jgi:hypothetical protein
MMGRLKPGSGPGAVAAQLGPLVLANLPEAAAREVRGEAPRVDAQPGSHGLEYGRTQFEDPLKVLAAVVGLALLMACANLAGLLLARAAARRKEITIRLAVGAGRWRLVRQLLVESALLSAGGAAAGLLVGRWGLQALLAMVKAGRFALPVEVHLDLRVLGFAAAVSMLTTVLFGLAPALRATRVDLAHGLEGGRSVAGREGTPGRRADAGGAANRGGAAAHRGRDAGGAQPGEPARHPAGVQCDARGHLRAGRGPQRVRRHAQRGALHAAAGRVEPHARRGGGQRVHRDADERIQLEYDDLRGRRQARRAEGQRHQRAIPGSVADSAGGGARPGGARHERRARRRDQREPGAPLFRPRGRRLGGVSAGRRRAVGRPGGGHRQGRQVRQAAGRSAGDDLRTVDADAVGRGDGSWISRCARRATRTR